MEFSFPKVTASTGISLSERFEFLEEQAVTERKQKQRSPKQVLVRSPTVPGAGGRLRGPAIGVDDESILLLEALASDPVVRSQLLGGQRRTGTTKKGSAKKPIKQRLGVKGRLGQRLEDRLGPVQYVRGGRGLAIFRSGRGGARGQLRGEAGTSWRGRGRSEARGHRSTSAVGSTSSTRGGTGGRGQRGRGRGPTGQRSRGRGGGGANQGGRGRFSKEQLDVQLDAYMTGKDRDVAME